MKLPESIESERLFLRKPAREDAKEVFESVASDDRLTKYLVWEPHDNVAQTEDFIESALEGWEAGSEFTYLIVEKTRGKTVGMFRLAVEREEGVAGYVITRDEWNKGYATEALRRMLSLLPGLGLARLAATCDIENGASARVMEKCGMEYAGTLPRHSIRPFFSKTGARDDLLYTRELG